MLRLLWAAVGPPTGRVAAVALLLGSVGLFAQALLLTAVVPNPPLLLQLYTGSVGIILGIALTVGTVVGTVVGLRRLVDEGAWLGLQSLGLSGVQLLLPLLVPLGLLTLLQLGVAHGLEPWARQQLREARVAAAGQIRPVEGKALRLGPWSVVLQGGTLYFAGQTLRGKATGWRLEPEREGLRMLLGEGELSAWDGTMGAHFSSLGTSIPLPKMGAPPAAEKSSRKLMEELAKKGHPERHQAERWLLWKRTLLPLGTLLLSVGAVPLALGRRPVPLVVGGLLLPFWVSVRMLDTMVARQGAGVAAACLLVGCALFSGISWGRWTAR
ncbi:MAG TPA: hypothetical protein PLA94_24480 [Myxococcota bacterium]|nr:hypothetical protein [Myxococcota bacterium]